MNVHLNAFQFFFFIYNDNNLVFKEMKKKHKKLKKETPLHIACKKGYIDLVKFLLERKEININSLSYTRSTFHFTPLHVAVSSNNFEIVKILLASNYIKVNEKAVEMNYEFSKYGILKKNIFLIKFKLLFF